MTYTYETVTVADTAIGFTAATLASSRPITGRDCKKVLVTVETAQIRFRVDGGTPTSAVGHILDVGDVAEIDGSDASKFLAIRTGSTSGAIKCSFEA